MISVIFTLCDVLWIVAVPTHVPKLLLLVVAHAKETEDTRTHDFLFWLLGLFDCVHHLLLGYEGVLEDKARD